jgi:hypothetical protein
MLVQSGMHQLEPVPERLPEARGIVTHDRQTAAPFRAIQRESADDGVAADLQGSPKARDVTGTVARFDEEVKRRPVVPDVVGLRRLPTRRVGNDPADLRGSILKPVLAASSADRDKSSTVTS